jgi:hypothetical protein
LLAEREKLLKLTNRFSLLGFSIFTENTSVLRIPDSFLIHGIEVHYQLFRIDILEARIKVLLVAFQATQYFREPFVKWCPREIPDDGSFVPQSCE